MLHVLCDPLQEAQRLIEGNWHCDLGELLEEARKTSGWASEASGQAPGANKPLYSSDLRITSQSLKFPYRQGLRNSLWASYLL